VRSGLAKVGSVIFEIVADNVQFPESWKAAARRASVVVDHITTLLQFQEGANDVLADIRFHGKRLRSKGR
jgi:hypothetical protein